MNGQALYDFTPTAHIALLGLALAAGPLAWVWLRRRSVSPAARLRALTLLALFLTFDLIVFGAFTRLTDSGLGCPDWPGCYGSASPLGAQAEIGAAQASQPSGPVTHGKAWIEMIHRYLATAVGVLIVVLALASWAEHRRSLRSGARAGISPWWATATLLWVVLQGAFGALTVTMKLYPAVVTAHLLGGIGLLALLAAQVQGEGREPWVLPRRVYAGVVAVLMLSVTQVALGGWVSANYAVIACADFPTCQGSWWPAMDFGQGFALRRALGQTADGAGLPFAALTAIHYAHRLMAYAVLAVVALLAWRIAVAARAQPALQRWAWALAGVALCQFGTGLANVVLGWPMAAALAHTAGAAALVALLTALLAGSRLAPHGLPMPRGVRLRFDAAH
jgi:cytochrome c oxidase assembly protein subunit 15